ncbi:hypothetical protein PM076_12290 [Halorubrum ezzemoulense]|uniref:Uncharacterized protein n=1 Tax=Halorubrum ezzemoulense TaxID=337243 RepID=A0A256J3D7_HALEZ|nr:hypothetical protein [Halorubrum ezzemoulense]MDB2244252.1 hypothetical protein [Halorubrum ezzemoulense]MDB2252302.1 hypothetical protein [Halorubrum ezzemoulense]MDB2277987.1 hypothetical protein [Halorubrum ezzemoulense]MDB2289614.1 hypothetical protein [Halorubrum ezzemoulense]MDB2292177.1 hypothetical protein [Halorubrum ezzemoulense]
MNYPRTVVYRLARRRPHTVDEPLSAPERTDVNPTPLAEPADGAPTDGPIRAAEPPPDPGDGAPRGPGSEEPRDLTRDPADDGADAEARGRDADEAETLEYRLERLRPLRAVVTLGVVVARLIRSV